MSEDVISDRIEDQIALINEGDDEAIGIVIASTGTVTVDRADGSTEVLSAGDRVYQDDVLSTDDGSSVGIRFADASRFSLGEEGKMQLDDFIYDPASETGNSLIDVMQGSFAFVSGMIAKTGDDAMTVSTPVATIGVRGTTVAGDVGPDGQTEVTLLPDTDGTLGEIAVFNEGGLQIMFDAFQRLDVTSATQAPSAPRTIDPSELREDIADTVRAIGADPTGSSSPNPDGGGDDGGDQEAAAAPEAEVQAEAEPQTEGDPDLTAAEVEGDVPPEVDPDALPENRVEGQIGDLPPKPELSDAEAEVMAAKIASISPAAGGDAMVVQTTDGKEFEVKIDDPTAGGTVFAPNGDVFDISTAALKGLRAFREKLSDELRDPGESEFRETRAEFENETLNFSPEAIEEYKLEEPLLESNLDKPPPPLSEPITSEPTLDPNTDGHAITSLTGTEVLEAPQLIDGGLVEDPNLNPDYLLTDAETSGELTNHPIDPGDETNTTIVDPNATADALSLIGSGNDLPEDPNTVV